MKRWIAFVLLLVTVVSAAGCSGRPKGCRKDVWDEAMQTINIIDDYWDGKYTKEEAYDRLALVNVMPLLEDSGDDINGRVESMIITLQVDFCSYALGDEKGSDGKTFSPAYFKGVRDKIAKELGYKK